MYNYALWKFTNYLLEVILNWMSNVLFKNPINVGYVIWLDKNIELVISAFYCFTKSGNNFPSTIHYISFAENK